MMTRITPPEWEALSAYLDNQLTEREHRRLEGQLHARPELRQALAELRQTRAVVRAAPRLRAPRNFTLTPQMAGARRAARPLPATFSLLRFASALATLFFVLVSAGSLYLRAYGPAPRVVAVAPADQSAQVEPAWGMGGGGGGMVEPPAAMAPAGPVTESMAIPDETAAAQALAQPEGPALEVTIEAQAEAPPEDPANAALAQGAPDAKQAPGQPVEQQTVGRASRSTWTVGWIILAVVQGLLLALAVGAALGAYAVRRSNRG